MYVAHFGMLLMPMNGIVVMAVCWKIDGNHINGMCVRHIMHEFWYFCEALPILANRQIEKALICLYEYVFRVFSSINTQQYMNFRIAHRFTIGECLCECVSVWCKSSKRFRNLKGFERTAISNGFHPSSSSSFIYHIGFSADARLRCSRQSAKHFIVISFIESST